MNKKIIALTAMVTLTLSPIAGFALIIPNQPTRSGAIDFARLVGALIDVLWIIFVAIVIIWLIVTAFLFLTTEGDPEKSKKARMALLFAIIGIVVALLGFRIFNTIHNLIIP